MNHKDKNNPINSIGGLTIIAIELLIIKKCPKKNEPKR